MQQGGDEMAMRDAAAEEGRKRRERSLPEAPEYLFRPTPARPRPEVPIEKDSSSWHRAVWVAPHLSAADVGYTGCGDGCKWRRWAATCCRCPADACRNPPGAARGATEVIMGWMQKTRRCEPLMEQRGEENLHFGGRDAVASRA